MRNAIFRHPSLWTPQGPLGLDSRQVDRALERCHEFPTVGIAVIDTEYRYLEINYFLASLNGIPREAHLNRTICSVVPTAGNMLTRLVELAFQVNKPISGVRFSVRVPFQDGRLRHWLGSFFPVRFGGVSAVIHSVIEVTDHAQVDEVLASLPRAPTESVSEEALTCREAEVLALIGCGKTTKEIASLLRISAQTVSNHRKQVCRKLNLHSTVEIAAHAARIALLHGPALPSSGRYAGTDNTGAIEHMRMVMPQENPATGEDEAVIQALACDETKARHLRQCSQDISIAI
jgi:DNA-binding CsgD family transcriptional regulator